jgi:hypothetical protein
VLILLGTAVALSQGGVGQTWWRRLPPARTAAWVIATFGVLSLASVLMAHLDTPGIVAVAGLAGVVDARAWYGLTAAAVRGAVERPPHPWYWRAALWRFRLALRQRTNWVPVAPLAAVMVLVLVAGMARLAFTGAVRFDPVTRAVVTGAATANAATAPATPKVASSPEPETRGAVLVVAGFGSSCCHSANALRAAEPQLEVRQFSYRGLTAAGQPVPYGRAGNLSLQVLGDRLAAQVEALSRQAGTPVDVVAESEGTLGLYAMLARHPHVPVGSVILLSPIVEPGQFGQAAGTVPGAALTTLNNLVGGMSPYGRSGAQALIDSVSEVGASYFAQISRDRGLPWLAVVPLADAVTLPACPWPRNVIFIDALHGGLLGDRSVQRIVETFLTTGAPGRDLDELAGGSQQDLRNAARLISGAAAAWRMPELHPACPS